ncbi:MULTISPECIES: hypothetical protein [Vagococcus]|uniref:Uncharacterized protein n=1 Tax=Vagococcus fluvialis bH819 TaxID=1255619 RepID=A0A1X6WQM4_9ENTE|nr:MULTISPECIES: hypothetical protein [Vagococcus]SLM85946.1 hypothetical protein FM121_07575 [Vagococcus fluvialis bH819]HCM88313.1 hypothetical protein [Vagococcus sp.]
MNEMYGLVEIENRNTLAFYFVTIDIVENDIVLSDRSNGKKPLNLSIPLNDITKFKTQTIFATEEISFYYQGLQYKFVEYGNHTIKYFGKLLDERLNLLAC